MLVMPAVLSLTIAFVGCGGESVNPIATYPYPPSGMFDQAATSGTLVRDGDCLYMENPDIPRSLVVFPDGVASWEDGRLVVDGVAFREGDTVAFGGGEGWFEGDPWVIPPDDDCDLTSIWRASGVLWHLLDMTSPLAQYAGERNGDDGRLEGILRRDGDCLYVDAGDYRPFLALPRDGVWWDEERGQLVFDDVRYDVDGPVAFGGSEAFDPAQIDWLWAPAESCDLSKVFVAGGPGTPR
jgi:hypothetical protein